VEIGVLIVSDDEHDVGDDEVVSSEVAEVGECAGKTSGDTDPVSQSLKIPYFKL